MPITTRTYVRASILYLCLGALLGLLLYVQRWLPLDPRIVLFKSSHVQFLVVGWLMQIIMGVGWWLFPPLAFGNRPGSPRPLRSGQQQRGSETLFWATFGLLNTGILLWAICDPLYNWTQIPLYGALAGISGFFLTAAAICFVVNVWARIRELGGSK